MNIKKYFYPLNNCCMLYTKYQKFGSDWQYNRNQIPSTAPHLPHTILKEKVIKKMQLNN